MIAAALLAAAVTAATPPPGYSVVKRLELSGPLGLKEPWVATILAPTGADASTGDKPVRVCFSGGREGRTDCQPIVNGGYDFQTFEDAKIETLSEARGVRALVLKASYSGGSHSLTCTTVWSVAGEGFVQTFASDLGDVGDDERFTAGSLDGYYLAANPVWTRPNETWWDPHRFSMAVYRLDRDGGYVQVLQYITATPYPAEREAPHQVVGGELQRVRRLLAEVYPAGPPP